MKTKLFEFYHQFKFISEGHYFDIANHQLSYYPSEWLDFLDSSPDCIIDSFADTLLEGSIDNSYPESLINWIHTAKSLYLDKQPKNVKELEIEMKYVKLKKLHEIKRQSCLILETIKKLDIDYIVDIGAGVGHLTQVLSQHHKVVAIESNKQYASQIKLNGNITVINEHITKTNLDFILYNISPTSTFLLTGLHACGDLSLITLTSFKTNQNIKAVISLGCCFQLQSEFPCSDLFSQIRLTKPQLNSACHVYTDFNHNRLISYWKSLSFRASLNNHLNLPPTTKLHFPPNATFEQFKQIASEKLGKHIEFDDGEKYMKLIGFVSLLRGLFSPILERLVLEDRCEYLKQDGFDCQLFPLFDPILSPRNICLLALKN
ncbi:hypothetical protein HDV01_006694 [Terramyces sp. JEL0728]|nr:hypothetical protein HDV01_006694 [Terramyces sp. JEL0728]